MLLYSNILQIHHMDVIVSTSDTTPTIEFKAFIDIDVLKFCKICSCQSGTVVIL